MNWLKWVASVLFCCLAAPAFGQGFGGQFYYAKGEQWGRPAAAGYAGAVYAGSGCQGSRPAAMYYAPTYGRSTYGAGCQGSYGVYAGTGCQGRAAMFYPPSVQASIGYLPPPQPMPRMTITYDLPDPQPVAAPGPAFGAIYAPAGDFAPPQAAGGAMVYGAKLAPGVYNTPSGRQAAPGLLSEPGAAFPFDGPVRRFFRRGFGYDQ